MCNTRGMEMLVQEAHYHKRVNGCDKPPNNEKIVVGGLIMEDIISILNSDIKIKIKWYPDKPGDTYTLRGKFINTDNPKLVSYEGKRTISKKKGEFKREKDWLTNRMKRKVKECEKKSNRNYKEDRDCIKDKHIQEQLDLMRDDARNIFGWAPGTCKTYFPDFTNNCLPFILSEMEKLNSNENLVTSEDMERYRQEIIEKYLKNPRGSGMRQEGERVANTRINASAHIYRELKIRIPSLPDVEFPDTAIIPGIIKEQIKVLDLNQLCRYIDIIDEYLVVNIGTRKISSINEIKDYIKTLEVSNCKEEINLIIENAKYARAIIVNFDCGLRRGEAAAITRHNIGKDNGEVISIIVNSQIHGSDNKRSDILKTENGYREIPLTPWMSSRFKKACEIIGEEEEDSIPVQPLKLNEKIKSALLQVGVESKKLDNIESALMINGEYDARNILNSDAPSSHLLRRNLSNLLIHQSGVSENIVKDLMGHRTRSRSTVSQKDYIGVSEAEEIIGYNLGLNNGKIIEVDDGLGGKIIVAGHPHVILKNTSEETKTVRIAIEPREPGSTVAVDTDGIIIESIIVPNHRTGRMHQTIIANVEKETEYD